METIPFTSSLLAAAAFDPDAQELHVTFRNSDKWIYGNGGQPFTQQDYDLFAGAASKGSWFLQQIRDVFPGRRG